MDCALHHTASGEVGLRIISCAFLLRRVRAHLHQFGGLLSLCCLSVCQYTFRSVIHTDRDRISGQLECKLKISLFIYTRYAKSFEAPCTISKCGIPHSPGACHRQKCWRWKYFVQSWSKRCPLSGVIYVGNPFFCMSFFAWVIHHIVFRPSAQGGQDIYSGVYCLLNWWIRKLQEAPVSTCKRITCEYDMCDKYQCIVALPSEVVLYGKQTRK